MTQEPRPKCEICGEPMPAGEEMFKFHGYSGPCPKPPIIREQQRTYTLTPQQVERARILANPHKYAMSDEQWIQQAFQLLREVVGDE